MPPKDKDPRKRNRGAEADAILKNRIEMVKAVARTEWADKNKRPGWKTMARHLEETQGKKLGYERGAIRLILKGTYKASKRLGIPGL